MDTQILREIHEELKELNRSKEHYDIIVSKNETDFTTVFNPPLELRSKRGYEIAMIDLETFYSFYNITEKNNIIKYENNGRIKTITIPPGSYEMKGLNKEIMRQLSSNGDTKAFFLFPNSNTFKSILKINTGYTVRFSHENSIKKILGFTQDSYNAGIHHSEKLVNILSINSIFVHINVVNGSIVNGIKNPVIYTFFPKVSPGFKIIQRPVNPIYLPIPLTSIRDFHVKLTDQDNNILDNNGEKLTIRFHVRER